MTNYISYILNFFPSTGDIRLAMIAGHIFLAFALFMLINWIGKHSKDFGYASTTLFEEPQDSLALNFFIRALAPTVFIVALSAVAVALGYAHLRMGIYWIVVVYYAIRVIYIFAGNIQRLISWPQFLFHSGVGIAVAYLAYNNLILPNRSLLPNIDTAGNELWLAIFAFMYAVANKVTVSGGPGARRRNAFIKRKYDQAVDSYGALINDEIKDYNLRLITYAIMIYEDYCRPPLVRTFERLCFWKQVRTTGIMQVASSKPLTDEESVKQGIKILLSAWQEFADKSLWERTRCTIAKYNKDDDYISRVDEVMEIIAKRIATEFLPAYKSIYSHDKHHEN